MSRMSVFPALLLLALAAGCSQGMRYDGAYTPAMAAAAPAYDLRRVNVITSPQLTVSEENSYYPMVNVVWRGEPRGDRLAQVRAIFDDAAKPALASHRQGRPVIADIEVTRFHALTEMARIQVGGDYSLRFHYRLRDARTGAVIDGPRAIDASFPAAGGQQALDDDAAGNGQRVQIVRHLQGVIQQLIATPDPKPAAQPAP